MTEVVFTYVHRHVIKFGMVSQVRYLIQNHCSVEIIMIVLKHVYTHTIEGTYYERAGCVHACL